MAERPAAEKKQSGAKKSIREVLTEQGGGLWYSPKSKASLGEYLDSESLQHNFCTVSLSFWGCRRSTL